MPGYQDVPPKSHQPPPPPHFIKNERSLITSSKLFRYMRINKLHSYFIFFAWPVIGKQNNTVKFGVPGFFACSGVPGCSSVPVFRCSGAFRSVPVFRGVPGCSGAFRGVPVFRCSGVPVFLCSCVPVFLCSCVPVFLVLVHAKTDRGFRRKWVAGAVLLEAPGNYRVR